MNLPYIVVNGFHSLSESKFTTERIKATTADELVGANEFTFVDAIKLVIISLLF